MNKLSLTILSLLISLSIFAENGLSDETNTNSVLVANEEGIETTASKDDIIINHSLIEKFNNAEYNSNQMSFASIMKDFSFQEIKQISQAYKSGDLEDLNTDAVNQFLKENKGNDIDTWLHLYSEL